MKPSFDERENNTRSHSKYTVSLIYDHMYSEQTGPRHKNLGKTGKSGTHVLTHNLAQNKNGQPAMGFLSYIAQVLS